MPLKSKEIYGAALALKNKVPPGSSQAKFYEDVADAVILILKDADVPGTGLVAPVGGGPVTGLAKIA